MSRPRRHTCLHLSYRTCRHHKTSNEQEQIKLLHRTRQDRQQLLLSNSNPLKRKATTDLGIWVRRPRQHMYERNNGNLPMRQRMLFLLVRSTLELLLQIDSFLQEKDSLRPHQQIPVESDSYLQRRQQVLNISPLLVVLLLQVLQELGRCLVLGRLYQILLEVEAKGCLLYLDKDSGEGRPAPAVA